MVNTDPYAPTGIIPVGTTGLPVPVPSTAVKSNSNVCSNKPVLRG